MAWEVIKILEKKNYQSVTREQLSYLILFAGERYVGQLHNSPFLTVFTLLLSYASAAFSST